MTRAILTGTGLFIPPHAITNEELVVALAASVDRYNADHAEAIAAGRVAGREHSSDAFIVKASGIARRYAMDKRGVLDPERLRPHLPCRRDDELSIQAEMSVAAIEGALAEAGRTGAEVDAVLVACSNLQRAYPAVAIEVQRAISATGFAYDMNVACSSATFAMQAAADAIRAGSARCVLVVSPEITTAHNNFALRDHHFIFGDACTAVVIEDARSARAASGLEILSTRMATQLSNNIRNNFGFLNACEDGGRASDELLFMQNGRQVFKEVCPMVARHLRDHLAAAGIDAKDLRRLWLHQANANMNRLIARTLLGEDPTPDVAPIVLDEFANTASAGSVIALHRHKDDLRYGDLGLLCSFGAGYSVGSILLRKTSLD